MGVVRVNRQESTQAVLSAFAWVALVLITIGLVAGSCSHTDPYRKLNVGRETCIQLKAGDPWTCE